MKRFLVGTLIVALSLSMILVLHDQQEMRESQAYVKQCLIAQSQAMTHMAHPKYPGVLDALKNTVTLLYDGGGHASGVIIKDDYVLTARHCVKSQLPSIVKAADGREYVPGSVKISELYDIAVLYVPGVTGTTELYQGTVEMFDPVFVLGTPAHPEFAQSIGYGMIVGLDFSMEGYWEHVWRYNAGTGKGNSGGPVVTPSGKIIGIHVGGPCVRVHSHGVMEPVTHIKEFLESL